MRPEERDMHLRAGMYFGQLATCGKKINYKSEISAAAAAIEMSLKSERNLEHYPCYYCDGWHIGRAMTEQEREVFMNSAGPSQETVTVGSQTLRVHSGVFCQGEYCSIHNPSNHKLKDATLNWRADRRIMERICEHGVGHPDPDDANFRRKRDGNRYDTGVHGCDGCC